MRNAVVMLLLLGASLGCERRESFRHGPEVAPVPPVAQVAQIGTTVDVVMAEAVPGLAEETISKTVAPPETSFWDRAESLYQQARETGSTTANSSAAWVAEKYDQAATGTQTASRQASDWMTALYRQAVHAGETSAVSTKEWVVDDLAKAGTWQYKILRSQDHVAAEAELNELGKQRWECFAVKPGDSATLYYLKRSHRSYLRQLPARDLLRLLPIFGGVGAE